ncbi:MAG: serine/threonine-protein phosphatase [Kiritimatiellae bacterium]|nr:serine/threonine-protein phosphatase [Kiritimatiellia bacterium]
MTDTGRVRDHNEDGFGIDRKLGLFLVVDGMGGHRAGDKAAEAVVELFPREVKDALAQSEEAGQDALVAGLARAVKSVGREIRAMIRKAPKLRGMGATLVTCLIRGRTVFVVHMGDSRAYRLREGTFERLTEDHSLVSLLRGLNLITSRQARVHPARNTISRYVGMSWDFGPEVRTLKLQEADRFLLCSDGLTNMVSERAIGQILLEEYDPKKACWQLVDAANAAGGKDNITALVVDWGKRSEAEHRKGKCRVKRPSRKKSPESLSAFIEQRI